MCNVTTLRVRSFGPLREAEIEFDKYTVFVGNQGTGKSTAAKLFSMFTWLEKSLVRGLPEAYMTKYNRFRRVVCGFHRISSYFEGGTELEYRGTYYNFGYSAGNFTVERVSRDGAYEVAKVMYVPAERNLLTSVEMGLRRGAVRHLPEALTALGDEYERAKRALGGYEMPMNGARFEYDKLNGVSWIRGAGYRVRVEEASSGFQSVLPMLLVSRYLAGEVKESKAGPTDSSVREEFARKIEEVMLDESLDEATRQAAMRAASSRFRYSGFVNIVEEPEQNLFPTSQRAVLNELVGYANAGETNRLVLTTHSPYLIGYITLAVKAYQLAESGVRPEVIGRVVPVGSFVRPEGLRIYEFGDGGVARLSDYRGLPVDDNLLNGRLGELDELFDELLDVEG